MDNDGNMKRKSIGVNLPTKKKKKKQQAFIKIYVCKFGSP